MKQNRVLAGNLILTEPNPDGERIQPVASKPMMKGLALVLLAVDAVLSEPVSGKNSLLTGDLQGKLEEFGRF